ncbi:MAG: orotate phosphoribosyltransferase [Myxococcota bacterium]
MLDAWVSVHRHRLLALLTEHAYADREVTLASGQKSRFYIDCKQVALRGEGHFLLGRLFLEAVQQIEASDGFRHDACGGMSIGADPLASALSLTAFLGGRELPAIYVRKEAKGHGTGAFLEGARAVATGGRVVLVEDVVTTGGSSLKAAARLRDHGYVVTHVLAIVDRLAGGAEAFRAEGLELLSLFTRADFPGAGA